MRFAILLISSSTIPTATTTSTKWTNSYEVWPIQAKPIHIRIYIYLLYPRCIQGRIAGYISYTKVPRASIENWRTTTAKWKLKANVCSTFCLSLFFRTTGYFCCCCCIRWKLALTLFAPACTRDHHSPPETYICEHCSRSIVVRHDYISSLV